MPMPALTLNNVSIGVPFMEEKKMNEMKMATIGSFRNNIDIKTLLPPNLYSSIFDPVPDNLDIKNLITVPNNQGKHFLNNAAFGRAFDDVLDLSGKLRHFAETFACQSQTQLSTWLKSSSRLKLSAPHKLHCWSDWGQEAQVVV